MHTTRMDDEYDEDALKAARESRYAYLLQPIRDLTQNWAIDIAHDLENYIEEVDRITVSFQDPIDDDDDDNINHSAANTLGNRRTTGHPSSSSSSSSSQSQQHHSFSFAEAALLIQGSACVYSKKVEYLYRLVYESLDHIVSKGRIRKQLKSSITDYGIDQDVDGDADADDDQFLSLDCLTIGTNIDLDESKCLNSASSSATATADASMRSTTTTNLARLLVPLGAAAADSSDDKPAGSHFRLNTCHLLKSGALLLDHYKPFEEDDDEGRSAVNNFYKDDAKKHGFDEDEDDEAVVFEGNDDDDDDEGGDGAPVDRMDQQQVPQTIPHSTSLGTTVAHPQQEPDLEPDHHDWKMLDPYDDSHSSKPFKKGITYRYPRHLDPKKMNQENHSVEAEYSPTETYLFRIRGPYFEEFDFLYELSLKQRAKRRKEVKNRLVNIEQTAVSDDDNVDGDQTTFMYEGGGDVSEDDCGDACFDPLAVHAAEEAYDGIDNLNYDAEARLRLNVARYFEDAQQHKHETQLSARISEWHQRIDPMIEMQEIRPKFDIENGAYGVNAIVDNLNEVGGVGAKVPISEIFKPPPHREDGVVEHWEVCRFFVAALQMVDYGHAAFLRGDSSEWIVQLLDMKSKFDKPQAISTKRTNSENFGTSEGETVRHRGKRPKR